jgi:hypothetical protein
LRKDGRGGAGLVFSELFEVEFVDTGTLAVELGMDFEAHEVVDDEKWRVSRSSWYSLSCF